MLKNEGNDKMKETHPQQNSSTPIRTPSILLLLYPLIN